MNGSNCSGKGITNFLYIKRAILLNYKSELEHPEEQCGVEVQNPTSDVQFLDSNPASLHPWASYIISVVLLISLWNGDDDGGGDNDIDNTII